MQFNNMSSGHLLRMSFLIFPNLVLHQTMQNVSFNLFHGECQNTVLGYKKRLKIRYGMRFRSVTIEIRVVGLISLVNETLLVKLWFVKDVMFCCCFREIFPGPHNLNASGDIPEN